jgi:uncharacterized protein YbbC (DUF1343 family)
MMDLYKHIRISRTFLQLTLPKLTGSEEMRKQIEAGKSEEEIRLSWEPALSRYKLMRQKYLLYK